MKAANRSLAETAPLADELAQTARRRLVLIVDDSRAQRRMLAILLTRAGYETAEASCGASALQFCAQRLPDFVVSDWVMPGMNGTELCEKIRAMENGDYVFIVLLTSKAEPTAITFGLQSGADDFLAKPVGSTELRARLRAGERIMQLQERSVATNLKLTNALAALRSAQAAMERDLDDARMLQQGLVGEKEAVFADFAVSTVLRPAGHIGGDLVGHFSINAQRFGVFAIDVCGHGVAAALMTARLAAQFSASVDQSAALYIDDSGHYDTRPPAEVARYLNHAMLTELSTDSYFTMIYAVIEKLSGRVRMVQAGHPHPLIQRADGTIHLVGEGGMPIGLIEEATYDEVTFTLAPGDRMLMASDGLWEAADSAGQMLGQDGLSDILGANRSNFGTSFLETMLWSVASFSSGPQEDDMSAFLVERSAPDS